MAPPQPAATAWPHSRLILLICFLCFLVAALVAAGILPWTPWQAWALGGVASWVLSTLVP